MTAINANWPRWIKASVFSYMEAQIKAQLGQKFLVLVAGEPERDIGKNQDWIEIRLDGPTFYPWSSGNFLAMCEINFLISTVINEDNFYRGEKMKGVLANILSSSIQLYKYGDGPNDDQSRFGCLQLEERIITHDFGQIEPHVPLRQATVEAVFAAEL